MQNLSNLLFLEMEHCNLSVRSRRNDRHLRRYCSHCKTCLSYSAYVVHKRKHSITEELVCNQGMDVDDHEQESYSLDESPRKEGGGTEYESDADMDMCSDACVEVGAAVEGL